MLTAMLVAGTAALTLNMPGRYTIGSPIHLFSDGPRAPR